MLLLDDLAFRWRLGRLLKDQDKISNRYQPDLERARRDKDWERENSVALDMFSERDFVDEKIARLQHAYLAKQARYLLIPLPEFKKEEGEWRELEQIGGYVLNDEALLRLARDVRQERRERIELAFLWPSALIGFVGGLVGLFSAFTN